MKVLSEFCELPKIILTNDWSAGFAAAYRKIGMFGNAFEVSLEADKNDSYCS